MFPQSLLAISYISGAKFGLCLLINVKPCRVALRLDRTLPRVVLGPVLFRAFSRLAMILRFGLTGPILLPGPKVFLPVGFVPWLLDQ